MKANPQKARNYHTHDTVTSCSHQAHVWKHPAINIQSYTSFFRKLRLHLVLIYSTSRKRPALPGRNNHHGPYFYVLVHTHFAGFFPSKLLLPLNASNLAQFEELGFSLIFQLTLIFSLILFVNMLLHAITVILMCISVGWVLRFPSLPRSTGFYRLKFIYIEISLVSNQICHCGLPVDFFLSDSRHHCHFQPLQMYHN